jgi:hypothetical protein
MPELLRYVLATQPLPDSPLRRRLEPSASEPACAHREILLWKTNYNMGNAAVGAASPRSAILLSDMLLETMNESRSKRYSPTRSRASSSIAMTWYVVLFATMMLLMAGPGQFVPNQFSDPRHPRWPGPDVIMPLALVGIGGFLLVFGFLSRWFGDRRMSSLPGSWNRKKAACGG